MSKLNQTDKYAIQYLHSQNKTVEEISTELGHTVSQVNKFIQTLDPLPPPPIPETNKVKDLMIRQTSVKKNNTVSIMTEGAAQVSDEFVKKLPSSNKNVSHIYRRPE